MLTSIIIKVLAFEGIAAVVGFIGGFLLACRSTEKHSRAIDTFYATIWQEVTQTAEWQRLDDLWERSMRDGTYAAFPSEEYYTALEKGIKVYEKTGKFPLDEFRKTIYNEIEKAKRAYENAA